MPASLSPTVLKLPTLARSKVGRAFVLPDSSGAGAGMEVLALEQPSPQAPRKTFYLCLEGELLIDLPYGNFVHLHSGDCVTLEAEISRTLVPVQGAVVLIHKL
jgi:hypothetical protein